MAKRSARVYLIYPRLTGKEEASARLAKRGGLDAACAAADEAIAHYDALWRRQRKDKPCVPQ